MSTDEDVAEMVVDPEVLNMSWFYVVRYFDDPDEAGVSYRAMDEQAAALGGAAQIAGYRMLDGLPTAGGQPRIVAVVGRVEERVKEAARTLGGVPYTLSPQMIRVLVMRRLRFLIAADALGAGPGHYAFHHGTGMKLDEKGQAVPMEEE